MNSERPAKVNLWMPLYLERHRAATSTMSHLEHSAFVYLSILLWENDGRLRDDDKWLARNLRLTAREWQGAREAVLQNFTAAGGFITDTDMIAEINRRKGVIEKRKTAGKASAAARAAAQQTSNTCSASVEQKGNDTRLVSNLYQGSGDRETLESDRPFRVIEGIGK